MTHRARIRKAYFKMLENEGEPVPEKKSEADMEGQDDEDKDFERARNRAGPSLSDGEKDDQKAGKGDSPIQTAAGKSIEKMSYQDRMKTKKDRKRKQKDERRRIFEAKKKEKDQAESLRLKHKKQMTKYTPRGQPLMGSRINRLLDKIKEDS